MVWVRLADDFTDHPKVIAAGPLASWLYVCGLTYANRYLTDGFIPAGQLRKLADVDNAAELAGRLVDLHLWEVVEGGYMIHDYHEYQPTSEAVKAEKEATRQRVSAFRARRKGAGNASGNGVTNAPGTPSPYPDPYPDPVPVPDPAETTPQPPPQAEGESPPTPRKRGARQARGRGAPPVPLGPLAAGDRELWAVAVERLQPDMNRANWENVVRALVPVGRAPDGGLQLRAPPGALAGRFRGHISRALADVGDAAATAVQIFE